MTIPALATAPFERIWNRLTAAEALALLTAEGFVPDAVTLPAPHFRAYGLLAELTYNDGAGYMAAEAATQYVGRILKDPAALSYQDSQTYHRAAWLIVGKLREHYLSSYAARLEMLEAAGLSEQRIAALASPLPSSTAGSRTTRLINWAGEDGPTAGKPHLMLAAKQIPWVQGDPVTLLPAADVAARLADRPAGQRCVRPLVDFILQQLSNGAWKNVLYDGSFVSWDTEPGVWLDQYLDRVLPIWTDWCAAWQAEVDDNDVLPIDWLVFNGEFDNNFYDIKTAAVGLGVPYGQPGRFDGAGNQIAADPRWAAAVPEIGVVDAAGNSLWHMGDPGHPQHWNRWNPSGDVRIMLFNAWLRRKLQAAYSQLVDIARQQPAFANTKAVMYDLGLRCGLYYPNANASGFDGNPLGAGLCLDDVSSVALYGSIPTHRYVWGSGSTATPPTTPWNWVVACCQGARAAAAASRRELMVWLAGKDEPNHAAADSPLYQEGVLHALMAADRVQPAFYAGDSTETSYQLLNDLAELFDSVVQADSQTVELGPSLDYSADFLLSTMDCGGRWLSRWTPRNEAGWTHELLVDAAAPGLVGVVYRPDGTQVVQEFPTGTVRAASALAPAGYWIEQTSLTHQDGEVSSTDRRIKITPYFQRHHIPNSVDGFRMMLVASDANEMPDKVFRYREIPLIPGTAVRKVEFDGVCSPADLAEMPEDTPYPDADPPWFRLSTVDLVFRSRHDANEAYKDLLGAVSNLVTTLNLMDDLEELPAVWYGSPPDDAVSSPSSSSSSAGG